MDKRISIKIPTKYLDGDKLYRLNWKIHERNLKKWVERENKKNEAQKKKFEVWLANKRKEFQKEYPNKRHIWINKNHGSD